VKAIKSDSDSDSDEQKRSSVVFEKKKPGVTPVELATKKRSPGFSRMRCDTLSSQLPPRVSPTLVTPL